MDGDDISLVPDPGDADAATDDEPLSPGVMGILEPDAPPGMTQGD